VTQVSEVLSRNEIESALERLLSAEEFRSSPQLAAFLRFVVTATLDGKNDRIKGYTIATEALGRGDDFDPQTDPIVRVEAIRLRRLKASHYDRVGLSEPVRTTIPRGTYVPIFARTTEAALPVAPVVQQSPVQDPSAKLRAIDERPVVSAPHLPAGVADAATVESAREAARALRSTERPRSLWRIFTAPRLALATAILALLVALAALTFDGDDQQTATPPPPPPGLTVDTRLPVRTEVRPGTPVRAPEALLATVQFTNLSSSPEGAQIALRFRERLLIALARFDELRLIAPATREADHGSAPRFRLAGHVEFNQGRAQIGLRVEKAETGEVLWSRDVRLLIGADTSVAEEEAVVRSVATSLGQPYGVLASASLQQLVQSTDDAAPYFVYLLSAFEYWRSYEGEQHQRTRACLEATVAAQPGFAKALPVRTYVYLDEYRFGFNRRDHRAPLDEALRVAQRAVELKPESARAIQALCSALFVRGDVAAGIAFCERSRALNPFDTDIAGDLGAKLIIANDYVRGLALIDEAVFFNPGRPIWYDVFRVLGAHLTGDVTTARILVRNMVLKDYALSHFCGALVSRAAGDTPAARAALMALHRLQPDFATNPRDALGRQFPNPLLVERLARELEAISLAN
jgi:TolB-like protein